MAALDGGGRITAWGGAASAILGYDAEAVVGRNAAGLLASDGDRPAVLAAARRCRVGESVRDTLAVRHRDGRRLRGRRPHRRRGGRRPRRRVRGQRPPLHP
ncbi:PAS domain S-box protein [Streptomyces sp. NPDC001307]|uniref:PAS domain S-box protein n=1 Tax=Streptomyces sp. NPDC001307 TaxID=3364560 RepID=UPI0036AE4E67